MAGASVLLLEDDPQIRDLLTEVVTSDGYPVRIVTSLDGLRQAASAGEITLAVLDAWGQSHGTLWEAERREIQGVARAIPTIMLTARRWAQTTPPAKLDLLGLVGTPFDLDELLVLIKECTERLLRDSIQACAEARQVRKSVVDAYERLRCVARRLQDVNAFPESGGTA